MATSSSVRQHAGSVSRRAYSVVAWGRNLESQCGVASGRPLVLVPEEVPGLGPLRSLAASKSHSAAVQEDGEVLTWGDGAAAKLGHGTTEACATPHRVESLVGRAGVTQAALGRRHSLFLDENGGAWTAGESRAGQGSLGLEAFAAREAERLRRPRVAPAATATGDSLAARLNGLFGGGATVSAPSAASASQRGAGGDPGVAASAGAGSSTLWVDRRRAGGEPAAPAAVEPAAASSGWHATHLLPMIDHAGRAGELAAAAAMYDPGLEARLGARNAAVGMETASRLGLTTAGYPLSTTGHPFRLPAAAFGGVPVRSAVAARHRTHVLTADGRVWSLGGDWAAADGVAAVDAVLARGWLPLAASAPPDVAAALAEGGGAVKLAAGGGFVAALTAAGGVVVWGAPVALGAPALSSGAESSAVLQSRGGGRIAAAHDTGPWTVPGVTSLLPGARAWRGSGHVALAVLGLPPIVDLAAGAAHLLLSDGRRVWSLGAATAPRSSSGTSAGAALSAEEFGLVPTGVGEDLAASWLSPRAVHDLGPDRGLRQLAAGGAASAAVDDDGRLTLWGSVLSQAAADALARAAAAAAEAGPLGAAVDAPGASAAIDTPGVTHAWGMEGWQGLSSPTPTLVPGLGRVRTIALGTQHALVEVEG